jgi:hypothetical protein
MAAATLTLGTGAASAQAEVTLRCQHFLSPMGSVPRFFIEPWAEKVEADSGGRIDVEIYPAMQLGGAPPALYDQIRDGVIDCGWAIPAYTPGRFPEAEAMELPFMTSMSGEASSMAAWDYTQAHLMERFSDVHLIAVHVHGPGVIHTTAGPIESIADFDGLQLRGPSRMANALLEELGATPVGMPVPAFPEALSRGTVDGGVIPWEVVPGAARRGTGREPHPDRRRPGALQHLFHLGDEPRHLQQPARGPQGRHRRQFRRRDLRLGRARDGRGRRPRLRGHLGARQYHRHAQRRGRGGTAESWARTSPSAGSRR